MPPSAADREHDRRNVTINVRASEQVRDLIDRAASIMGKTRSDFMLETARERARDVLLDQTVFALDEKNHAEFQRILDAPAPANDRLRKLLRDPSPWET